MTLRIRAGMSTCDFSRVMRPARIVDMSSRSVTMLASRFALVWPVCISRRAWSLSVPQTPANALASTLVMVASGVRSSCETFAMKSSLI